MASVTVSYGGNTIRSTTSDETYKLKTSGKYLTDDIVITASDLEELSVAYGGNEILNASGTFLRKLKTAGKLLTDDITLEVVTVPPVEPFLTFSSADPFTLRAGSGGKYWDGTLEYSTNKNTWSVWDGTDINSGSLDGKNVLYLRGTGNTQISSGLATYKWTINGTDILCAGNIETLLDYQTVLNGSHPSMASSAFGYLFNGWSELITAPDLSATTLSSNCYCRMFEGCTKLTATPFLPATVIPEGTQALGTYSGMFAECTSLTGMIDLRHVTTIENWGANLHSPIPVLFGTALTSVSSRAFDRNMVISGAYFTQMYFYFTDNDVPSFDPSYLIGAGAQKAPATYNIYTDNTAIKNGVLSKADQYTIVNVYHLDGSAWT